MPTHAERRFLPFRPQQLYDLVADVERYPEFLPWCTACRITARRGTTVTANLMIGFKMVREQFTSCITFHPEELCIGVEYTSGPLRYLNNHWVFESAPGGCLIDFYIDFEFKSRLFQRMVGLVFNEAVGRMVNAFEARARALHVALPPPAAEPTASPASGN